MGHGKFVEGQSWPQSLYKNTVKNGAEYTASIEQDGNLVMSPQHTKLEASDVPANP